MGGAAKVAYQLSAHLGKLGHQVTVVTTNYGWEAARFPAGDFELVVLPNLAAGFGFYLSPQLVRWAHDHIENFDIIHMQTLRTFQNGVIHHFCRKLSLPYIISAHGTAPIFMQRQIPKKIYDWIIGRKLIEHAICMHAVSEVEVEQFNQIGIPHEKISLIPNGLDVEVEPIKPNKKPANTDDQANGNRILFVGRLHPIKSVDVLIKACAMLPEPFSYQLVIAGPDEGALGQWQSLTEKLGIQDKVTFTGPRYGEEKAVQFRRADLVVMPSAYEIFGLVPFEALAFGIPVIVSEGTGAGRLINKIDAGFLFPANDEQALSEAIIHALAHPEEAQQKVANGQSYIRAHLTWEAIINEYVTLYQELISS